MKLRQQHRASRTTRGFSLVEVMISVAILATIMILVYGSVSTTFRLQKVSLDRFDRYRTVQQGLDRMSRELSMAFVTNIGQRPMNDRGVITYQTIFDGTDDSINFTSLSHTQVFASEAASDQVELSYRLERQRGDDGEMHQNLVRRQDAPIDGEPDEGGVKYTMIRDVEQIRFEYWDPTRDIAGEAWVRQWDAENDHNGSLPSRVRITIEIEHPTRTDDTLEFSTQTEIHLVDPIIIVPPSVYDEIAEFNEAAQALLDALAEEP